MAGQPSSTSEHAPAKVNLVLHVGPRRSDGLHQLCSLIASIDLADTLIVHPGAEGEAVGHAGGQAPDDRVDEVECPGVIGPNLVEDALMSFRRAAPGSLPPVRVRIEKRIPVAAGLGGGSADAAAALRAANRLAGEPLDADALRAVGATIGSDVPSQVEPRSSLVTGGGERVEPLELPPMTLVLVPGAVGLSTADVYAEADRIGATRESLDPDAVRAVASRSLWELARGMENDLEAAALSLRHGLDSTRARLLEAGALAAQVSGSGPTVFGVFEEQRAAPTAAAGIPGAVVVSTRRS